MLGVIQFLKFQKFEKIDWKEDSEYTRCLSISNLIKKATGYTKLGHTGYLGKKCYQTIENN